MAKLNITWSQFEMCNDNPTKAFEDMCRRLFTADFLKNKVRPHSDHNNAGIEVLPILEPEREDGQPGKRISFQCKYVDRPSYAYSEFQKSAKTTAKKYKGKLDLVYLFCNKTLTTTTSGYKSIIKAHADAGIETQPISNDEVLDMVANYQDIAEYFFQARIVADRTGLQPTVFNGMPVYVISADHIVSNDTEKPKNDELLRELISEKLTNCLNHALAFELDALKSEVEKLVSFGADNGDLYFYKLLLLLRNGKDTTEALDKCGAEYKQEAEWLVEFYASKFVVSAYEFNKHIPIVQLFIVDRLFVLERWKDIITLYDQIADTVDLSIKTQFDLHYGMSLLNLQENQKAHEIFHSLYERTREQRMLFYDICSRIRLENLVYQSGITGHHDELARLIEQLNELKQIKQYTQQELFVAALKMESSYHLGLADKAYLEEAISEFDLYSESTRKNTIIRYYYALCLELNGSRNDAIAVYEGIDWKMDLAIAERYMICLILNEQPKKAIEVYSQIKQKTVRTEAVYLLALECSDDENYIDELKKTLEKYKDSPTDLFVIACFSNGEGLARDVVIPALREAISEESLSALQSYQKIKLAAYLAHCSEIELMETVLNAVEDISTANSFEIGEVYKALFDVANKEYSREEEEFQNQAALEAAERIADKFLSVNLSRKNFLQIKVLCAGAKKMPYSSLKYSKELFEITHDAEMARSVVALLCNRNETKASEYEPYLEVLKKSDIPDHCIITAHAMLVLGRTDAAEFYAYKALYLLNGEDDYHIYRNYFGLCNYNLHRFHADTTVRSVLGGVVVTLEEDGAGEESRFEICLDQEADFSDDANRSMGIEHIVSTNPDYIKLRGSGLGQVLRLRDKKYKIVEIMPRSQYGLRFIFKKIQEKPEMFKGVVWTISTDNVDDMIKQIKELTDNSERIKSVLASYNFENNEAGLPIDAIAFGDYSQYIPAFKFLLYKKGEAFYAGQPIYENEDGQKYVPGLATLMLLSVMRRMDVLDAIKDQLIIPESYITFFQEEYSKAAGLNQVSYSTLYFVDDKPVMADPDKGIPEIWEDILNFCRSCHTKTITDQERIDFKIADVLSGERFIIGLNINSIHLDALLLSQREKATFLCDDLFFRRIAAWMGVRNLNIVSLVQHYTNPDYMVPFIKELSKTNYIYIPLLARNDDEFNEILDNVLNGKKKEVFYSEIIQKYFNISYSVLLKYLGGEFVDKVHEEQPDKEEKP